MDFANAYAQGFARVAARIVPIRLAQPQANAAAILDDVRVLAGDHVAVVAYPELSLTGYSCEDLFLQDALIDAATAAILTLVEASAHLDPLIIVGAPVRWGARLYNCAIGLRDGAIVGVVPKTYIPTYAEFYESRWFAPAPPEADGPATTHIGPYQAVFGAGQVWDLADVPGLAVGVEICEDMWVPAPRSGELALAGATVIVNPSGSPITIGKADDRKLLARAASARGHAAYVFTAAGPGESSTDLSWDGQTFVYECGDLLGESARFPVGPTGTIVDIDLRRIVAERARVGTFEANRRRVGVAGGSDRASLAPGVGQRGRFRLSQVAEGSGVPGAGMTGAGDIGLRRPIDRFPFVPSDATRLAQDCYEAYNIQVYGLVQRMKAIGNPKLVIGVSGGLDSTHALIVCAKAMDALNRPRSDILAFTMPGFATSAATRSSALALMDAIGTTAQTLDIRPAAQQMLADLGHPFAGGVPQYDVTFENVQAGLRTDYLFRLANQRGGIVVGTGDLSELALGWCTYGVGDHMSHYGVNAGVPKTLIQYLIRWVMAQGLVGEGANTILDTILHQEISPELVPATDGRTLQSTESLIGPYALHDFFAYHLLRGATPSRIAFLAWHAWRDRAAGAWPAGWPADRLVDYDLATIRHWETQFLTRFFANQFKRTALPNGPKVSAGGTLSPRGDWRMPSDVSAATWLQDLAEVPEEV